MREAQEANGYQIRGGRFISVFVWLILGGLFVAIAAGSIAAVIMCMDSDGQREYEKLRRNEQGEGDKQEAVGENVANTRQQTATV